MADPVIRFKRSAVAGKRPTLANVELGEVALNTYDGNLFTRQDTGGVGIGTTVTLLTPWQELYGAAAISYSGDVNITGNLAVDATTLFVNSANNRIGIGTDNPAYQVEIENTGANALLVLDRTDGAACFIEGQAARSAFGSVNATPLALAYNSFAVVTIGAGGSIRVNPDGDGYTFPTTDGTANQVLQTDGSGNLSFADQFSGVGISSDGTYIGSGVTAFDFVGASVTNITAPSAGFSTISIDFNGLTGIFAKTENKFSATEGQTSFPINYEIGYIDVFLNGVRLNSDNFTATDGSTVGLTTAASAGDAVDIVVYEPQSSATPKRVVTNATATAGQTAFTVPSYDTGSNSMDVFLNGIKLDSAEFTETDGTTVTLAVGAALNDELQFISYESDNNFWSLNGSTLHRTSPSNPVAIGTDVSAGDYLTVGQVGASGTSLFVHGGARITGILTVGSGSVTIDGSTNQITGLSGGISGTGQIDAPGGVVVGNGFSMFSQDGSYLRLGHVTGGNSRLSLGVGSTIILGAVDAGLRIDPNDLDSGAGGDSSFVEPDSKTITAQFFIGRAGNSSGDAGVGALRFVDYGSSDNTGGGIISFENNRFGTNSGNSNLAAIKGTRTAFNVGSLKLYTSSGSGLVERCRISDRGFTDTAGTPIAITELQSVDGTWSYSGTSTRISDDIGSIGDFQRGYTILCPAYNGSNKYAEYFDGTVYHLRGSNTANDAVGACRVLVCSAYNGDQYGGVTISDFSGTWDIVSLTYDGSPYLAVRRASGSGCRIFLDGIYTNTFTPIAVADASVSSVTVLATI